MASEIERKFLLLNDSWRDGKPGVRIVQGYLSQDPDRTVRVRISGDKAWITIKGRSRNITRSEHEYTIPILDAEELLGMCLPSVIDKTRHRIPYGEHLWEIDVFHGDNDGLVVAEVELENESVTPQIPPWLGPEVSSDERYFNSCLATRPFSRWGDS